MFPARVPSQCESNDASDVVHKISAKEATGSDQECVTEPSVNDWRRTTPDGRHRVAGKNVSMAHRQQQACEDDRALRSQTTVGGTQRRRRV